MNDFNLQRMYSQMPFRKKVSLFLYQNHFLFWKITLMDVTIVVPLFILIGFTLDRCTPLSFCYAILIAACICGIIGHFRIRYRRVKTYQHLSDQVANVRQMLDRYAEAVERSGSEEDRERLAERMAKVEVLNSLVEHMAGIVYNEDVLGFSDEEEQA